MFTTMISKLGVKGLVAGSVLSLMPTAAMAGDHDFRHDRGYDRDRGGIRVEVPVVVSQPVCETRQVWVEPVYQTVDQQQWVAPVYQTVTEQVWVPEGTTTQCTKVFVPDQYGFQNVVQYDRRGNGHLVQQRVLISAAHYEDRQQPVCTPAHYETRSHQVLVADGHYQCVPVQTVVVAGHWQTVAGLVIERHEDRGVRLEVRLPF